MSRTLYCGNQVFAGSNLEVVEAGAVLVDGAKIEAVGRQADFSGFAGNVVRCPVIMPGLVDCHAHLALDADIHKWTERVADPEAEHVLRAMKTIHDDLWSGVTTVRYMGDKYFIDVAVKRALAEGRIQGPRAIISTRGMKAAHAHGYVGYAVDGVEARRAFVRENLRMGADLIKLFLTDTVLRPKMYCYPSRAEIAVAVEEAHNIGKPVAAHCAGGEGFDFCVDLGVDTIEHGYFASRRQFDKLAKADRWLVVTPTPIMSDYYGERCAPEAARNFVNSRSALADSMREAIRSGVKYAVGSDGLHGKLADDIAHMVDFGAERAAAIRAATIQGARACGVSDVTGSLEAGKQADILGLDANPFADIAALKRVALVVRSGAIYRNTIGSAR